MMMVFLAIPLGAQSVSAGIYEVEVSTDPDPPIVGDNQLLLSVTREGTPATDVSVTVSYDMVGMSMDMTPPTLESQGSGRFSGPLLLSMPGLWKLEIAIAGPQGNSTAEVTLRTGESKPQTQKMSESGHYQVRLNTTPSSPTVGDTPTRIEVKTQEGEPVDDLTVFVGAEMPGMTMGLRPIRALALGDGVYEATVPLSMEGLWKLEVEVGQENHEFTTIVARPHDMAGFVPWLALALALFALALALVRGWRPPLWQIVVLLLLLVGAVALTRYANSRRPKDKSMGMAMDMAAADMGMNISDMQAPVPVAIASVETGTVAMTVNYTGTVKPFLDETIYPRVEGYLLELPLYPGDRVAAGQVVGRLDSNELSLLQARAQANVQAANSRTARADAEAEATRARVEMAQAELEAAQKSSERERVEIERTQADLDYWKGVLDREKELFLAEAVSQQELDEKEARYATAKAVHHHSLVGFERSQAEVRAKRAALAESRRQVSAFEAGLAESRARERVAELDAAVKSTVADYTVLRSNISGVVTERITDPGVLVRPGMGLLRIAQMERVRLQFTVAQEDLRYIAKGTPITVTSLALRRPFQAEVSSLFHSVDARSRTGIVEAVVDNPDGDALLPGSYVVGDFALRTENDVLWLPREALVPYFEEDTVWLAVPRAGQLVAVRRAVRTGAEEASRLEILDGLSEGDRVVVAGHENLVDGSPIVEASYGKGIYKNLLLPEKDAQEPASEGSPDQARMHGGGQL